MGEKERMRGEHVVIEVEEKREGIGESKEKRKGTRKRGRRSQVNISLLKYSLEQFLGRWVGPTGWSSLFQCLNRDAGMCVCVGVYVLLCMRVYVLLCMCVYVFVPVGGGVSAYASFLCV